MQEGGRVQERGLETDHDYDGVEEGGSEGGSEVNHDVDFETDDGEVEHGEMEDVVHS